MSRAFLTKQAESTGRLIGGLAGAGVGGIGGYNLGKLLSASRAAQLLTSAVGAGAGGLLGFKMGEGVDKFKDPEKLDRPWAVANRKQLWELAGGLGGAGLGLAGSYAFGQSDKPVVNLLSALMLGGLGAAAGGSAFEQVDNGLTEDMVRDAKKHKYKYSDKKDSDWMKRFAEKREEKAAERDFTEDLGRLFKATVQYGKDSYSKHPIGTTAVVGASILGEPTREIVKNIGYNRAAQRLLREAATQAGNVGLPAELVTSETVGHLARAIREQAYKGATLPHGLKALYDRPLRFLFGKGTREAAENVVKGLKGQEFVNAVRNLAQRGVTASKGGVPVIRDLLRFARLIY